MAPSPNEPELIQYTGPGCELCDVMRAQLADLEREFAFTLREVDVSGERELKREFGRRIPVLALDGEVLSEGRLDLERVRAALHRARRAGC